MARLLLAEDEAVLRMLVVDTLEDEGHEIHTAADGEEALSKLKQGRYDLVILDHMMPKMTGLEVLLLARKMPEHQQTKIIMLSAKSQQSEQEKVLAAGADEFMSKPFSPLELVARVGDMLNE